MVKDPWLCDCDHDQISHRFAGPCLNCSCQAFTTDRCECDFEADPNDSEEDQLYPWYYRRVCRGCQHVWYSLHCEHDRNQDACPSCGWVFFAYEGGEAYYNMIEPVYHDAKSEYIEVKGPDWGDKDSA